LHCTQKLQAGKFLFEIIERHQHVDRLRATGSVGELLFAEPFEDEYSTRFESAHNRLVKGEAQRHREMTETGDDPRPCSRFYGKVAQICKDRCDPDVALYCQMHRLL
jgi:hypothetical protein